MKKKLIELYLDYVNNWLTVQAIADHHDIERDEIEYLLTLGKKYHESNVKNGNPLNI